MKTIHISALHRAAKARKPGYLEACMKVGRTGLAGYLQMSDADHAAIAEQFAIIKRPRTSAPRQGLGDRLHAIAGPIGQAIKWPCMKRTAAGQVTTDLRPGSPCDKARATLNKAGETVKTLLIN